MGKRVTNWVGKTLGQTTILEKLKEKDVNNYFIYKCKCSCGEEFTRSSSAISQAKKLGSNMSCADCRKKNQSIRLTSLHQQGKLTHKSA